MRARSEPEVFTLYDVVRRVKGMSWADEEGSSARGRAPHGLAVTPRAWHASWWLSSTVQSVGLERGRGGRPVCQGACALWPFWADTEQGRADARKSKQQAQLNE